VDRPTAGCRTGTGPDIEITANTYLQMKIDFVTEDGTTFAIAQKTTYKGKFYDELMFAELDKHPTEGWFVRWEDSFMIKIPVASAEEGKKLILRDLVLHKPHVNGAVFDLTE
jgi:hypothetical protein